MRKIAWARVIATAVTLAIFIYLLASFVDVNMHNTLGAGYGNFADWNFFIWLFGIL